MISIIIRTKNEERWMRPCLEAILRQKVDMPVEVILVDNASGDKTVEKAFAVHPDIKLVQVDKFRPGAAINDGVRASSGQYIVCLSAHCLPVNDDWLARLLANFENEPDLAGVYGRQLPMNFSAPSDKRDLLITFGLDRRVQYKDPFFHNANSMIPRHVWDRFPFDEEVTNIEDRLWANEVLAAGMHIVYEPEAPVFHHHGIHQANDAKRAESVVRIMEASTVPDAASEHPLRPGQFDVVAFLPVRATLEDLGRVEVKRLLALTLSVLKHSKFTNTVLVSTDDQELADYVKAGGAAVASLRPENLAMNLPRVDDVLAYELGRLEQQGRIPDAIVSLEITHPFRSTELLDQLIGRFFESGCETMVAGIPEFRPCWVREGGDFHRIDQFLKQRKERDPVHVALPALGCVSLPAAIRAIGRFGERTTIFELNDPLAAIEVRSKDTLAGVSQALRSYEQRYAQSAPDSVREPSAVSA
jgi:GT2 family glycosyltransferase